MTGADEDLAPLKGALGDLLAARRSTAGLTQLQLARAISYGRTTVATAESGHRQPAAEFWTACDKVLGAGGDLIRAYEQLAAARQRRSEHRVQVERARRGARPETNLPAVMDSDPGASIEKFDRALPRVDVRHLVSSGTVFEEVLDHLREQWHSLVRTDNLLGPRFALPGVLTQIETIELVLPTLRGAARRDAVQLAAQYAESAAWLYEDSDHMVAAHHWVGRAMEWAYEAGDASMVAWTIFRRSQQAGATRDAARTIGLARAARRNEDQLAAPMRAAIRVQEAYGSALDGDDRSSQQLLDEAHTYAASDAVGDARGGHGSYCTAGHIEINRALCLSAMGQYKQAVNLYQKGIRSLPAVYHRNRASAQSQLAATYVAIGQVEEAAAVAREALAVAGGAGAGRTLRDITELSVKLAPHRRLPTVAALLDDLRAESDGGRP